VQAPEEYLRRYPNLNPKERLTAYFAAVTCRDDAIGEVIRTLQEIVR